MGHLFIVPVEQSKLSDRIFCGPDKLANSLDARIAQTLNWRMLAEQCPERVDTPRAILVVAIRLALFS